MTTTAQSTLPVPAEARCLHIRALLGYPRERWATQTIAARPQSAAILDLKVESTQALLVWRADCDISTKIDRPQGFKSTPGSFNRTALQKSARKLVAWTITAARHQARSPTNWRAPRCGIGRYDRLAKFGGKPTPGVVRHGRGTLSLLLLEPAG